MELAKEKTSFSAQPTQKVSIPRREEPRKRPTVEFVPTRYMPNATTMRSTLSNRANPPLRALRSAGSTMGGQKDSRLNLNYDWRTQCMKLSHKRKLKPLMPQLPKLIPAPENPPANSSEDEKAAERVEDVDDSKLFEAPPTRGGGESSPQPNPRSSPGRIPLQPPNAPRVTARTPGRGSMSFQGGTDFRPTLDNPDIETEPAFKDLCLMDANQLASVQNFEIEHQQYGTIKWLEPVDLRGVNLDKVIKFKPKSYELYEEDHKPEWGEGLMAAHKVWIYHVWPKGYSEQHKPDYDRELRWNRTLEAMCNRKNVEFQGWTNGILEFMIPNPLMYDDEF